MASYFKWPVILVVGWGLGWLSHYYWLSLRLPKNVTSSVLANEAPQRLQQTVDATLETPSFIQDSAQSGVTLVHEKLAMHQYEQVIQLLLDDNFTQQLDNMRQAIIEHLRLLLASHDYIHADRLFSLYLEVEYRDVTVLLMRAQSYTGQQQFELAIDTLYKARSYEYREPQMANLIEKIRKLVERFDKTLRNLKNNEARLTLFERLTTLEPDYSPYFVELARVQMSMGNTTQARLSLSLVEYDPQVSRQVKQLLKQIEHNAAITEAELATIPLTRRGDHFIVKAWINNHTVINLLIDTGASLTMIRSDVLQAAGVSRSANQAVRRFNTANGTIHTAVVLLDSLSMGEQSVNDLEVGRLNSDNFHVADGLLGMNFLKHFKFFIDQGEHVLRLTPP
ncbi:MAG: TIGR02281 family clan AA aspartic protease [Gammaproteobacteria bacterium]|nr:TIGR02281 family clan AA aspartic protease [Gammaproteobacteria bacterium]